MLYADNDTALARYIFNIYQPILIIFWQEIAVEFELAAWQCACGAELNSKHLDLHCVSKNIPDIFRCDSRC